MFSQRQLLRCILTISAVVWSQQTAQPQDAEKDWKLKPLRYNNPGLVVDLGVGLWADPLPVDYDQDGDWDLLVSCSDKPTSSVLYFENVGNDPSEKMPVFAPGVRVARAYKYMTASQLGDATVLMRPGAIIRRQADGTFNFDSPTKVDTSIFPKGPNIARTRANMWRMVDYDGDGDQDLYQGLGDWTDYGWDHAYDGDGTWLNGPLHGYVSVAINQRTDKDPDYVKAVRVKSAGRDVDVYGWPSPNFCDFDGDGDLDLLCGEFLDGFNYFENVGNRTKPQYAASRRILAPDGTPVRMHVQMITPNAVDWDRDGDMDLIVGDEDGRVALVEHTGEARNGLPIFEQPKYFQQQADTLKFGALATPCTHDWDGDGDEDILCGNTAGEIGWFENLGAGDGGLPKWDKVKLLEIGEGPNRQTFRVQAGQSGSIQGPCEAKWGYTTFSVGDWDDDGDADIVYNSILAEIRCLRRDGDRLIDGPLRSTSEFSPEVPPAWHWNQQASQATLSQWRTTPYVVNFDGDSKLDLVALDQKGYLTLRRSGGAAEHVFIGTDGRPLQLARGSCGSSGRVKLCVVDWDGDGQLDVLVNSENAAWYRNCGRHDGKTLLKPVGNLARRNVAGHTSSPAVCDFGGDGKPDLLVGSEDGRIYHIAHDDCTSFEPSLLEGTVAAEQPAILADSDSVAKGGVPIKEEFIFGTVPFAECHASTICETSRGLVAAWFAGTREGKKDVAIWVSYNGGKGWSRPVAVADGVQHADLRYPCWNPVLYQPPGDAPLMLFFKVGPSPSEWWGEVMISYDRGRTFTDRRRLPEGIDGPVRCKPLLLSDGTLLCGSSTEYDGWRVHFEKVKLHRESLPGTWQRIGPINDASKFNAIQPTFLTHADGSIQALCRTKEGVIASTTSTDKGDSWSALTATSLPNPNSGIESVTLADGRHLLVYNHLDSGNSGWGRRGLLNLAISEDGKDWKPVGVLENEKGSEFSYPAMIQSADGKVHIIYTHRRKNIKHVTLDPSTIE